MRGPDRSSFGPSSSLVYARFSFKFGSELGVQGRSDIRVCNLGPELQVRSFKSRASSPEGASSPELQVRSFKSGASSLELSKKVCSASCAQLAVPQKDVREVGLARDKRCGPVTLDLVGAVEASDLPGPLYFAQRLRQKTRTHTHARSQDSSTPASTPAREILHVTQQQTFPPRAVISSSYHLVVFSSFHLVNAPHSNLSRWLTLLHPFQRCRF